MKTISFLFTLLFAASAVAGFVSAKPVWAKGRSQEVNSFCALRCGLRDVIARPVVLRVTAAYDYRVRLDGRFIGFGPIRGPEGVFRIDEWTLDIPDGKGRLEIEAAGYNCNCYYFINQPAFVQAEVLAGGKVVAATGDGKSFAGYDEGRIRKTPRFCGQRTFIDAWRIGPAASRPVEIEERPAGRYEARPMAYPDFAVNGSFRPIRKERLTKDSSRKIVRPAFIEPPVKPGRTSSCRTSWRPIRITNCRDTPEPASKAN